MCHQITYLGINRKVSSTTDGSLLDASIANQIPHLHECGGNGQCTTCRIRVVDGMRNISPMMEHERLIAHARKWDPTIRLACMCRVNGDVEIQRLIWSSGEVNQIQKEMSPEGKAEVRPIAILFCDLRNFTKLSEENETFDIAYFLNKFYTALGDPILMNNGIIYQYVGDEIIGVFGTSGGTRNKNCMDAMRAAIGMKRALELLNEIELKAFNVKLEIGIGINYGIAYVGHLGHPTHRQFSVIGDPVNVASRIEGQTKVLGAQILIHESLHTFGDTDSLKIGRQFSVSVAGKEDKLNLYELLDFQEMDMQSELQSSLPILLKDEDKFAELFYEKVFKKAPFVKALFRSNMKDQGRLMTHMLGGIVYALARPEYLEMGLKKLGNSHLKYGVKEAYYPLVKEVMLETISTILGEHASTKTIQAWDAALNYVTQKMTEGAKTLSVAS